MHQNNEAHWDKVYTHNTDSQVGWYQGNPQTSLELIFRFIPDKNTPVIDIGAGNSHLASELLKNGFTNLAVADISEVALDRAREKLGKQSPKVTLIKSSVLELDPGRTFGLWHDRAVYHFLHRQEELERYKKSLLKCLSPGGIFILGTFSLNGPDMCSGLPVNRQSPESIKAQFGDHLNILDSFTIDHITPGGKAQNYLFSVMKRKK